jgi:hypothetical protein
MIVRKLPGMGLRHAEASGGRASDVLLGPTAPASPASTFNGLPLFRGFTPVRLPDDFVAGFSVWSCSLRRRSNSASTPHNEPFRPFGDTLMFNEKPVRQLGVKSDVAGSLAQE